MADAVMPDDLPRGIVDALQRMWSEVAGPGAAYSGAERVAIASGVRRARLGAHPGSDLTGPTAEVVWGVAADPAGVRRSWVESLVGGGLGYERYVEIVGLVSRVVAADTFTAAIGLADWPLPAPVAGGPTGEFASQARLGAGWVPMVGGTSITQALSLVPAENAALEGFHGSMYLTFEEMSDPTITRALTRPQMELVAARTSAINECFY